MKITPLTVKGEKLLTFFNLHRDQQRPRLQELLDYYLTNNRGINKREGRDEPYADYRIAHAFVKMALILFGATLWNEITFRDEKYNEEIQNINDLNDAHVTNVEILEDCIIYGRAYEIVYRNVENQDIFKRLDPKNVFVIYSNDIEVEPFAAVRYRSEKNKR